MIYASDLDRTLIYSQLFLDMHPTSAKLELADESKVNSYISKDVAINLQRITKLPGITFIPVTTRSVKEYKRIKIQGLNPEYAITSNGGTILHNGEILPEWKRYTDDNIDRNELDEIRKRFNSLESLSNYEARIIDDVYVFSKSKDRDKTKIELAQLRKEYPHYKFYLDKHKVYAINNHIGKDIALTWLKQYLNEDKIVASGDSSFDVPMLSIADTAIVPSHKSIKPEEINFSYIEVTGEVLSPLETFRILENV